ncbi:MAG: lamin tail domain-containing protein [Candidatus Eisenbacteria bacterium]
MRPVLLSSHDLPGSRSGTLSFHGPLSSLTRRLPSSDLPCALVCLVFLCLSPSHAVSQVVVNEVLYDPEGSDTGLEFVEIANCGRDGVPLSGWTLETGNGANPDDWTVEWIGGDFDYLEPGELFLVGESSVVPAPDYVTALDLQNGPDGVRLTDGVSVVDVVGWGEPLFHEYYEGSPAVDAPSGSSLARSPDCFDHDDNALDLRERSVPTPGTWNAYQVDLSVEALHPGPVVFDASEPVPLRCVVRNEGSLTVAAAAAAVVATLDGAASPAAEAHPGVDLSPRDTVLVDLSLPAGDGYHVATVVVSVEGDGGPANDASWTSFTVGAPAGLLKVSEIMFSPGDAGTEWVEFRNTTVDAVDASGWFLGDGVDMHAIVAASDHGARVPGGGHIVVARDTSSLGAPVCAVAGTDGWEALSADDTIVLLDAFGTPVERVTYDDAWGGERGVSLERVRVDIPAEEACNWGSSVDPSGSTPCEENSIYLPASAVRGHLSAAPNPFTPDGDGSDDRTVISYDLPVARAVLRITVYDVLGRKRATLVDHDATPSRGEVLWDGRGSAGEPLPSGLYVVRLEAIDARRGVLVDEKEAVGLVR